MTAQQPQRAGNQVVQYQQPQPPVQRPVAPPSAPQQTMQPAQYQQTQNVQPMQPQQPPIYHDPTATFVDPEEPFRNNSLMGAIRGQASFRATFLWWIVGFFFFGFFAVQGGIAIAIIPMAIWFWGGIFLMFWNARNIYDGKLKRIVLWVLSILFVLMIYGASQG